MIFLSAPWGHNGLPEYLFKLSYRPEILAPWLKLNNEVSMWFSDMWVPKLLLPPRKIRI